MIKIFGKVHYHWQPDLSVLVTYWSIAVIPVFIGLALMYESSSVPTLVLFSFFLFMALLAIGIHRYFTIYDDGILRIITANPFTPIKVKIESIEKIEVNKKSIKLIFINALALNPYFKGEVVLTDNFIHVDYYEMYYATK